MESEFEPAVHTEETPEAHIVIVHLPGFNRKDLRVQINNRGNLILSGERGVEMEQTTKVGGTVKKIQSGRHKFRKVIGVPDNVDTDKVTAQMKDEILRVTLPFVQKNQKSLTEEVRGGGKLHTADLSEQSKPDERSNPVQKQGWMQELPAAVQNDQSAIFPEVRRPDDYKAKASASEEESKAEAPMHAPDFVHGKPEAPRHAPDFVHGKPPISTHTEAVSAQAGSDRDQSQDLQLKSKTRKEDGESRLPSPIVQFPHKLFQIPSSSRRLMLSNREVFIAPIMLVLCAALYLSAMYLSYILRSRKTD